jgi:hypothetical protein
MIGKNIILAALLLLSVALQATDNPKGYTTARGNVLVAQKSKKASIFINAIWCEAEEISIRRHVPMSIILAQSIYESGCGTSRRCKEDNNYFGLKGKGYFFRFKDMAACFACYESTITQIKYGIPCSQEEWLMALDRHWGAECEYVEELKKIIRCYKLDLADGCTNP